MAIACLLHSGRVVSSSIINRLYHGDWPFYGATEKYCFPELMSVGHGWICEGVITASCHSGSCIVAGCSGDALCNVQAGTCVVVNIGREKKTKVVVDQVKVFSNQVT